MSVTSQGMSIQGERPAKMIQERSSHLDSCLWLRLMNQRRILPILIFLTNTVQGFVIYFQQPALFKVRLNKSPSPAKVVISSILDILCESLQILLRLNTDCS